MIPVLSEANSGLITHKRCKLGVLSLVQFGFALVSLVTSQSFFISRRSSVAI